MKQGNGVDLLGPNESRGTEVGIIYVSPTDDRQSVLAAIITQEKLGRKQVAIVLPEQNKAFHDHRDFEDLKSYRRRLHTRLIIIVPSGEQADLARQRRFDVYSSLENYASALRQEFKAGEQQKKSWLFGSQRFKSTSGKDDESEERPKPIATPTAREQHKDSARAVSDGHTALAGAAGLGAGMLAADLAGSKGLEQVGGAARSAKPSPVSPASPPPGPGDLPDDYDHYPTEMDEADALLHDEDDYALAPSEPPAVAENKAPAVTAGAVAASQIPGTPANGSEPHIIELPVRSRNTAKLPPRPDLEAPAPPPAHRNGGKVAAVSAGAAGSALATRNANVGGQPPVRSGFGGGNGGGGGPRPGRRRWPWWFAALLIFATVAFIAVLVIFLTFGSGSNAVFKSGPNATITITPDSKVVANSYIILAVPGQADPGQLQITARQLTSLPQTQTKNIKATGHNQQPAVSATGKLTFSNGSFTPFTVKAGTEFQTANGTKILTDAPAFIPAAGSSFGMYTVSAHAEVGGTAGNIAADSIDTICCTSGNFVKVRNSNAFSGGQDAKDYNFVKQSDYDAAINALKDQLSKQANSALALQVKSTEQLAAASQCPDAVTKNNEVGDKGVNVDAVDVSVSVTCKAVAYDQAGMQSIVMNRLQTKATQDLGSGYALQGNIFTHSSVQKVNADNSISLLVDSRGLWVYQFANDFKDQVARDVAGKPVEQARTQLKAQKGIAAATVAINSNTLPTDPKQIEVVIQQIPPIKDTTPTPGNNPVNPPSSGQGTPQPGNG